MPENVLKVENLKKTIGKRTIVQDLSFELQKGEIFGFLGPNGAGKTTTIKMIVGLSQITEGNIFINGYSVKTEFKKAIRNVGCIVENPSMYKYLSGEQNLLLIAGLYGVDNDRVPEILKQVGLQKAAKDKVKTYSLGMKQRLGIAQALIHDPNLLILDEPTNGLDPAGIREMRELLSGLSKEKGLTVFISSHILAEMQQLCDRVGIIRDGRIVTVKPVDELLQMAGDPDKARLLIKTGDNARALQILTDAHFACSAEADGLHLETEKQRVPEVVSLLAGAGIAVYGMDNVDAHSLEDIFMKLTEKENQLPS